MKYLFAAAMFAATPALAQTAPAPAPAPTTAPAPAAAARLNLDTPIETIVADPKGKEVLTADLAGDVTANPSYEQFKSMSLNQVKGFAPDKLTDAVLAKVATDLAAIK